ncbi:MAG: hypothetical protein SXG53_27375 [Pseudomonadota bacterium]|nr:hypothetical protein [Pseudorhizobium marinum]MDY6949426.1 hypothetical protein [Pseudomonadota bacterium]
MPYRQTAKVLAEFLPIEPIETYATMRKRTIRIVERLDDQIVRETSKARAQADDRGQLEMQLPGDRRKEFVISIDTAHVRSADPKAARSFELVAARCGRGEPGGRYFVTGSTAQQAIRDRALHALEGVRYRGFGDVTVISDGTARLHSLRVQLLTYNRSNRGTIVDYGKRHRAGLRVATTLAESAVNSLVGKRMVKKQQMRWSLHGANMLMQVRAAEANGELRDRLRTPFRQPEANRPTLFKPKRPLLNAA